MSPVYGDLKYVPVPIERRARLGGLLDFYYRHAACVPSCHVHTTLRDATGASSTPRSRRARPGASSHE
jgi:hypothetical protein